jgi:putative transposase
MAGEFWLSDEQWARLVDKAEEWEWSSVRAHLAGQSDRFVKVAPALDRIGDFAAFLEEPFDEAASYADLRKAERIGRPVGSKEWLADMEASSGLTLSPGKRGPKPKLASPGN